MNEKEIAQAREISKGIDQEIEAAFPARSVAYEVTGRVYEALEAWARDKTGNNFCDSRDCQDCKLRAAIAAEMPELLAPPTASPS